MCFRPAGLVRAIKCPECGTFNKPDATTCQKCGFEAPPMDEQATPPAAAGSAPKAPGNAPQAPSQPKAPGGPPSQPAAPKSPDA